MLKKILPLVLLSINLFLSKPITANTPSEEKTSLTEIVIWCGVGVGAVAITIVYAPIVIPAVIAGAKGTATVVATKTVAAGAAIKAGCVTVAPVAIKANSAIALGKIGKQLVYSSPEEKLQAALQQEYTEYSQAKLDLEKCINEHIVSTLDIPKSCKEKAMILALLAQEKFTAEKK
jgi:hypothetical protein